ncbi:MAG TPA: lytic transglycosylase domain-containing protein [Candidatus Aphodoplasma excrementigallinarum]|uniref:Lytic transglycosylase domain-containing protein n=1 Tax=Candidatus Aphodoplasma excrementigallinarum TaxID=2840673 RepID=A0A9D1T0B6_9FIRM|nr:lytic transglycosylase domain-containing protein [Candidatus Aphodoplasma excrementigallinarum]
MKVLYPVAYEHTVLEHARKNELDPYLVLGLIKAESNFVCDAQSHKDAKGLMQLTDSTAEWVAGKMGMEGFTTDQLSDPEVNISLGCWYLRHLLNSYDGDQTLALCAYNAGSGNVDKWLSDSRYSSNGETLDAIPFPETENYVQNTEKYTKQYKKLYPSLFDGLGS